MKDEESVTDKLSYSNPITLSKPGRFLFPSTATVMPSPLHLYTSTPALLSSVWCLVSTVSPRPYAAAASLPTA